MIYSNEERRNYTAENKSQAYFWTKAWQEAEQEAENDIRSGRGKTFDSVEELIKDLEGSASQLQ